MNISVILAMHYPPCYDAYRQALLTVQFWSKCPPNPSFPSDAQAHVAADWTLLMWHVAQHISDCIGASPQEWSQASSHLTTHMSKSVCAYVPAGYDVLGIRI